MKYSTGHHCTFHRTDPGAVPEQGLGARAHGAVPARRMSGLRLFAIRTNATSRFEFDSAAPSFVRGSERRCRSCPCPDPGPCSGPCPACRSHYCTGEFLRRSRAQQQKRLWGLDRAFLHFLLDAAQEGRASRDAEAQSWEFLGFPAQAVSEHGGSRIRGGGVAFGKQGGRASEMARPVHGGARRVELLEQLLRSRADRLLGCEVEAREGERAWRRWLRTYERSWCEVRLRSCPCPCYACRFHYGIGEFLTRSAGVAQARVSPPWHPEPFRRSPENRRGASDRPFFLFLRDAAQEYEPCAMLRRILEVSWVFLHSPFLGMAGRGFVWAASLSESKASERAGSSCARRCSTGWVLELQLRSRADRLLGCEGDAREAERAWWRWLRTYQRGSSSSFEWRWCAGISGRFWRVN